MTNRVEPIKLNYGFLCKNQLYKNKKAIIALKFYSNFRTRPASLKILCIVYQRFKVFSYNVVANGANVHYISWGGKYASRPSKKYVRPQTATFEPPTHSCTQKYALAYPTPVQAYSCNTFSKYNEFKKIQKYEAN